jgi:hypothetical protein
MKSNITGTLLVEEPTGQMLWCPDGCDFYQEQLYCDPHCDPPRRGDIAYIFHWIDDEIELDVERDVVFVDDIALISAQLQPT